MSRPIPLGQVDTGGNGGMIMALVVCCLCSSSSGVAGFFFRDKITAAMGGKKSAPAPVAVRRPRPSIAKSRKIGRRIRRRRPKRRRIKRVARNLRKIFRRRRPRRRRPKRVARKFGGIFRRRRSRRLGGRRCFAPNTPITLQNGETRAIKNIELGDVLANGSVVKATMEILNEDDPYYKLPGDILVTGSHYVKVGDTFKQIKNVSDAEKTSRVDPVVACLITSDHKIPVGDYIFWDWEDNLVV